MSEERVLCTYLGGIKRVQIHDLSKLFVAQGNTFVADPSKLPEVAANIGDLIGYLNKQDAEQYPTGGPTPDPGTGPLARFDSAPSQWAKWHPGFFTPEEQAAALLRWPENGGVAVHQHMNWWDGQGGYKLQGERRANGSYYYFVPKPPPPGGDPAGYYGFDAVLDTGGAADAYVASLLAKPTPDFPSGRPMIAPLG